jgi:hypothetical protein
MMIIIAITRAAVIKHRLPDTIETFIRIYMPTTLTPRLFYMVF